MFPSLFRRTHMVLVAGTLGLAGVNVIPSVITSHPHTFTIVSSAHADDTLGQDVGKYLQKAQTALASHNIAQAMKAVDTADSVTHKSSYETYVIAQMRAAVATQSGNAQAAIKAYDVLINSPRTPASSKKQMLMAEASIAYSARDYASSARAASRYLHDIGPDQQMQTLLIQCRYLQQDWAGTVAAVHDALAADQKAGRTPPENQLQMLATAYGNLRNATGQTEAYVQLVKHYPRAQYWQILIHNLVSDNTLSPRLVFNLQRLRLATGVLTNPSDFQDMAERAVQMNLPQLALNLLDEGYHRHLLGTGPNAAEEARFHAFVAQQANKTRDTLPTAIQQATTTTTAAPALTTGYNLVLNGQVDRGLELIKSGLTKNPRFPDIAKLEMGMALMDGGRTNDAMSLFNSMNGDGPVNDLAQLWAVYLHGRSAH